MRSLSGALRNRVVRVAYGDAAPSRRPDAAQPSDEEIRHHRSQVLVLQRASARSQVKVQFIMPNRIIASGPRHAVARLGERRPITAANPDDHIALAGDDLGAVRARKVLHVLHQHAVPCRRVLVLGHEAGDEPPQLRGGRQPFLLHLADDRCSRST